MKIRSGFVSNSSSSSFICNICGRTEVGYDVGLQDVEMCECVNGHVICLEELLEELPSPEDGRNYEYYYEVNEKYCPICNFLEASNSDLKRYLLKETKIPEDEVFAEVKKLNKRRKKLYDNEYVMYACEKANIDRNKILPTIKEKFKSYREFLKYVKTNE